MTTSEVIVRVKSSYVLPAMIALIALVNVALGTVVSNVWLSAVGGLGLCYAALRVAYAVRQPAAKADRRSPRAVHPPAGAPRTLVDPNDTDALVEQMLSQGRFPLLLRSQIAGNLSAEQFDRALVELEENMAVVPDGEVVLGRVDDALDDGKLDAEELVETQGRVIHVQPYFLDRWPVTNRQFYEFVAVGGYEQMALWDKTIWPAVLDLVDRTGKPGPRFWQDGCYRPGEEDHPVVGVCWHEAAAFARWLGKRLPSDAEWVKAGSWPVPLSKDERSQRRYPWGEAMDLKRANVWGAASGRIVNVREFSEGVSVGGVYQLIGNVWEWTAADFINGDHPLGELILPSPMKSIRGGAFDTFFDAQATCQFQSGESPLRRRHNIGFRCAVGACDLVLTQPVAAGGSRSGENPKPADEGLQVEEVLV